MTMRFLGTIVLRFVIFFGLFGALLFGVAGRWDVPTFWVYLGIFLLYFVVGTITMVKTDPTLIQERIKPGPGGKDRYLRPLAILGFAGHLVVAALDVGRYHWSDGVPLALQLGGLAVLVAALSLSTWAVSANRFFSFDARIQRDRGHHLISGGPYRFIRHPGYAATVLMALASPLALGSYWSLVPVLTVMILILRRLFIEEHLLFAELEGYAEYAARVRFRFVPGVW